MFVTPGSFTPPGRVMLQFLSPRLKASHKVAGSTSTPPIPDMWTDCDDVIVGPILIIVIILALLGRLN